MANQHRPARVTANLGIPVSGDDETADYVTAWGHTADEIDARVTAAVASANQSFSSAITAAQNGALPLNLMLMGA